MKVKCTPRENLVDVHFVVCRYIEKIFFQNKVPSLKACLGLMIRLVNKTDMVLVIMVIMSLM